MLAHKSFRVSKLAHERICAPAIYCIKTLIDMNLSPEWVGVFSDHSIEALHWSSIVNKGSSRGGTTKQPKNYVGTKILVFRLLRRRTSFSQ